MIGSSTNYTSRYEFYFMSPTVEALCREAAQAVNGYILPGINGKGKSLAISAVDSYIKEQNKGQLGVKLSALYHKPMNSFSSIMVAVNLLFKDYENADVVNALIQMESIVQAIENRRKDETIVRYAPVNSLLIGAFLGMVGEMHQQLTSNKHNQTHSIRGISAEFMANEVMGSFTKHLAFFGEKLGMLNTEEFRAKNPSVQKITP